MGSEPGQIERIVQADALAEGLALILVVGPEVRARPGLERIHGAIGREREALWHRLDRQGPDLKATLDQATSERPLVLVHGLERLGDEARQDVEARLNLRRDTLAGASATIIVWIPRPALDEFQRRSPDFWHWRSLLVEVTKDDVFMDPEVEETITYLQALLARLDKAEPAPRYAIEPDVSDESGARLPLFTWADKVQRGLLYGPPGSGKSAALTILRRYAVTRAWDAVEVGLAAPIPLFTTGHSFGHLAGAHPGNPAAIFEALAGVVGLHDGVRLDVALIRGWAASGELLLLMDGVDELSGDPRHTCVESLVELCRQAPAIRVVATSHESMEHALVDFERSQIVQWNQDQVAEYLRRRLTDRAERALAAMKSMRNPRMRELLESPRWIELLAEYIEQRGTVPVSRLELSEHRLYRINRLYRRGRTVESLEVWERALQHLALELMTKSRTIGRDDLLPALKQAFDGEQLPSWRMVDMLGLFRAMGILGEQPDGSFGFIDRAIQEDLAVYELNNKGPQDAAEVLTEHLDDPDWREVAIMTWASFVRLYGEPSMIWDNLWPSDPGLTTGQRLARMFMALEAAIEAGLAVDDIAAYRDQAAELAGSAEADEFPAEREQLQQTLARLADSAGEVSP